MLEFAEGLAVQGIDLVRLFMVLAGIVIVLLTLIRTRALMPVLGTVLLVAIALWAVSPSGVSWLPERVEEDTARIIDSQTDGGTGATGGVGDQP